MGKYSAAKMSGAQDAKFQNAYNSLIDLIESGYVSESIIAGHKVRVTVDPKNGLLLTRDGVSILGLDPDTGNILLYNGNVVTTKPFTSTRGIGSQVTTIADGGILSERYTPMIAGASVIDEATEMVQLFLKDSDGTPSYKLFEISGNYTVNEDGSITNKLIYIGDTSYTSLNSYGCDLLLRFKRNSIQVDSTGMFLSWYDSTNSTYTELGIDSTGVYKSIDNGSKVYL